MHYKKAAKSARHCASHLGRDFGWEMLGRESARNKNICKMRLLILGLLFVLYSCHWQSVKEKVTQYESSKTSDSILVLHRYPSGKIEHTVRIIDSLDCEEFHIHYYENGIIKERGCQGHYASFGVPVDTWYKFDSLGIITEKRIYKHGKKYGNVTIIKFDKRGQILEEIIQGYHPDFGELDSIWSRKVYK